MHKGDIDTSLEAKRQGKKESLSTCYVDFVNEHVHNNSLHLVASEEARR